MHATRKLAGFLRPYWLWSILAPLLMMLEVAMDLVQPRLVQRIIDQGIAQNDLNIVFSTVIMMIGLALIGVAGGMGASFFAVWAAQGFGADLRSTLFRHVQSFSFGNLDELETGKIITRLTSDVIQVQELVMILLRIMVRAPLMLVGSLIMAILTSPPLSLLFVVLIPIVLFFLIWIINRTFPMFGAVQAKLDAINTVMQENLAGMRVVKAFSRADYEIDRFSTVNDDWMDHNLKAVRTVAVTMPFMMLIVNTGVIATLWFGGIQINQGTMQIGQVVAFINYLMVTLTSMMMVSMVVMRVSRAEASAVRIVEVFEREPKVVAASEPVRTFEPKGRVAFEHVRFSYADEDHAPVLQQINFVVEPGETVALLGATGSGKSSLINLIPRFYDVDEGRVTIDGIDVRQIEKTALRQQVGVVLQESVLFSGSIRDNIRYGRPQADEEEVITAAKMAQAHDFISGFPDGYDSIVGQRGVTLSGGQRQRVAIARALLTQPAILVLDDSTSAVDVETEARLQEALAQARQGKTSFVVAQRVGTVLNADKILVLENGRIVAAGNHDTLLGASEIYREIYESQMGNGTLNHG